MTAIPSVELEANQRLCPLCNHVITYTLIGNCRAAERRKLTCRSCTSSLMAGGKGNAKLDEANRRCADCHVVKPTAQFMRDTRANNRYYSYCDDCRKRRAREYNRTTNRFKKLGVELTHDEYTELLKKQNGICPICVTKMISPCVDHCHTTGVVRGLLCRQCNAAIGSLGDDPKRLERAIIYLRGDK